MKIKDPLLVKVFAGQRLTKQELRDELIHHRANHQQTLELYQHLTESLRSLEEPLREKYLLPSQTLKLGVKIEKAWLEWVDELENDLDSLPLKN